MKAFVTGCAGFIGSHLTEKLLEKGFEVIGIDCFTDYYSKEIKEKNMKNFINNPDFKFLEKDILNLNDFPEVDFVFHLAAQAGVRKSWGKTFEIYANNNILATQALLEFYKDKELKKFVYSSSSSVYGDTNLPMKETNPLRPLSPYGVTKLSAENLCYLYFKNYKVPSVSLRYFTVYGPRQRPDMAIHKFVKAISNNKEIEIFGDGNQTRDFTFVSDVVESNLLAAKNEAVGEVFNVGGGNRININNLIKIIEENLGKKAKIIYTEKQKGDAQDTLADTCKIEEFLGWKPMIGIEEGIKMFVDSYQ